MEETGESNASLVSEQLDAEVQQAVDDAACYCEAWLLMPAYGPGHVLKDEEKDLRPGLVDPPGGSGDTSDVRLKRYADAHRDASGKRTACGFTPISQTQDVYTTSGTGLSASSPHGALSMRTLTSQQIAQEHETNACLSNKTSWSAAARTPESPNASFCRADFNYCLAQQLALKAGSLARSPSTREARDAIVAEARTRFALSGNVLATQFTDTPTNHCGSSPAPLPSDAPCVNYNTCSNWAFGAKKVHYSSQLRTQPACHLVCDDDPDPALTGNGVVPKSKPGCYSVCGPAPGQQCTNFLAAEIKALTDAIPASVPGARSYVLLTSKLESGLCTVSGDTAIADSKDAPPCTCKTRNHRDVAECQRVTGSYGDLALARLGDAVAQVGELTVDQAKSRMAQSDSLALANANGALSYGDQIWGASSGRLEAAKAIAGAPSTVASGDIPAYASGLQTDDKATQMLALLEAFAITLPYQVCSDRTRGFLTLDATSAAGWYQRILTDIGDAARTRFNLPETGTSADLVRNTLGLNEVDVAAALRLLRDQLSTLDVDHTFTPVAPNPQQANCQLANYRRNRDELRQRSPLPLLATLGKPGGALSVPFVDGWNKASAELIRPLGGNGQLFLLRKNLIQLDNRQAFTDKRKQQLSDAVRIADGWAGDSWTDYQLSCLGGSCTGLWRATGEVVTPGATLGLVASADDVACLEQGHVPGADTSESCRDGAFTAVTTSTPSPASDWARRPALQFSVTPLELNKRKYVMERTCQADPSPCQYRLIDVFDTGIDDTVHAVGGELNALLGNVLAKTPHNPGQALVNALGVANDAVPSLSFGFTGTVLDDWYQGYVNDANGAAKDVKQRLIEQFNNELQFIQQEKTTDFNQQALQAAQQDILTQTCGDNLAGNCAVERVPSVTLAELQLVPPAGHDPGGATPGQSCVNFLASFHFEPPDDHVKDYVSQQLKAALRCTRWASLVLASSVTVYDIPTSVRDQLVAGAETATFPNLGGKVRDLHISLFSDLRKLGIALREFDTTYQIAMLNLDNALAKIDDSEPDLWQQIACYSTRILTAAATVGMLYTQFEVAVGATDLTGLVISALKSGSLARGGIEVIDSINGIVTAGDCSSEDAAQAEARSAFASVLATMDDLHRLGDQATALVGEVALADSALDALEASVAIADARYRLESQLVATSAMFDPAWRFMQANTAKDTRRYLREAQSQLFEARRAVEFRTGEDLRFISDGAQFQCGAPGSWANAIFALDFPAANNGGAVGALAASQIESEAGCLYKFMHNDYIKHRPFALTETVRILRLSELLVSQTGADPTTSIQDLMSFRCADSEHFRLGGRDVDEAAGVAPCAAHGGVVEARLSFEVPVPYRNYLSDAFTVGHDVNYRITSLALNLLGSALKDCTSPAPSRLCDDNKDIPYSLHQSEHVWVDNFDGARRMYAMTPGVIEADARARDEPISTPNLSLIQPFEARQFKDRPLAGGFTIQFTEPTNYQIRWRNLEDIQLIVRFEHWTPQH